jgi:uncharacterized protein YjbI with pentapeptide repeats
MRIKNLTPFAAGAVVTSRRPPQAEMMLVVRGSFRIAVDEPLQPLDDIPTGADHLGGDLFSGDDREGECLRASDFADFKLRGELLVTASCHPPEKPATECPVRLRFDGRDKLLRVSGRRVFGAVGVSETEPFEALPLRWANSFGGDGFEHNPAGVGFDSDELPQVEYADDLMHARGDRPKPASLGPVHPDWSARASLVGKDYGSAWRKERAPFYAADFDWAFFQAAPEDQQLESGYFRGDESLGFDNLHPDAAILDIELPGVRARAFARDDQGDSREIELVLDTVHADLEAGLMHLSWRGLTPVRERDLDDVTSVLVVSEPLGTAEDAAGYHQLLADYERDPTGVSDELASMHALLERAQQDIELSDEEKTGNAISDLLKRKLGEHQPELQAKVVEAIDQAREAMRPEDRDQLEERLEASAEAADVDAPPPVRLLRPRTGVDPGLRRSMRTLLEQAAEIERNLAEVEGLPDAQRSQVEEQVAEMKQVPVDPRWVELDPDYRPPLEPLSDDEPGPDADLVERDFTGSDWSGKDLSGADLSGAILTRCNLRGANLSGAKLGKAILFKADLSEADLSGADLTKTNAAFVVAHAVCLSGAHLDQAFFEDADLKDATLDAVTGSHQVFTRANLQGANLSGASLRGADFEHARLDNAQLDDAALDGALLSDISATSASWSRANLDGASLANATLTDGLFEAIRSERSFWLEADLTGAVLTGARLIRADFTKATLQNAAMSGADLAQARMYRANLDGADLSGANLFEAELSRASMTETKLVKANLYAASLIDAFGKDADFHLAILTASSLES